MIVLSNCLTEVVDEGCRKVANSLIKRIKQANLATTIVSYESSSRLSDFYFPINKLMLNKELAALLQKKKEPLLYVPAPAKMISLAIRVLILSLFARWGLKVILVMQFPVGKLAKFLIKVSGAQFITISRSSWLYYQEAIGADAQYLKVGVDTQQFKPVTESEKERLRKKYGLPMDKPIVVHVGHLNAGRNIGHLLSVDEAFHTVLVVSTLTANEQDDQLRKLLTEKSNITIIDTFLPNIEEIYQLADVYLFPVVETQSCIDAPLSALEAASCNLPVVTTPFGELKELLNKEGFYQIESFEPESLNRLLQTACAEKKDVRKSVLEYDWNIAVNNLLSQNM